MPECVGLFGLISAEIPTTTELLATEAGHRHRWRSIPSFGRSWKTRSAHTGLDQQHSLQRPPDWLSRPRVSGPVGSMPGEFPRQGLDADGVDPPPPQ